MFFSMRSLFVGVLILLAPAAWAQVATRPETKIVPSDSAFHNEFGNSVAIDGDWMVIGDQVDDYGAPPTGAAYVYRRRGADWAEVAKLTSGLADDAFGLSVDISGSTIVVGAWADHETGSFSKGATYVYGRTPGTEEWSLQAKLRAADGAFGDAFGNAVAIHRDTIVVGAYLADTTVDLNTGAAFVFERSAHGTWQEAAKLWPDGAQRGDLFGRAVAVSRCRVLVGAPWTDGLRVQSGAAYVFDGCAGAGWRQTAKLTSGDLDTFFGTAVALDGGTAVVGANANNEHGTFTGAAYVFGRHEGGLNQWGRRASLAAYDAERDKNFGWSVAVRGETVVVGARGDDHTGPQAGAAYVFRRHVGGRNRYGPVKKLTASDSSFGFEDFGWSVDVSDSLVVIGAPKGGPEPFTGAAYLYPVPTSEPVCDVAARATAEGVTLDFRLGPTLPADWSVWARISGRWWQLWAVPLPIVEPPVAYSVPLPDLDSSRRIWFLSALRTGENGLVCADWAHLDP
jgi:FG-GAP repeat